mgnify:CR=1 FL=1
MHKHLFFVLGLLFIGLGAAPSALATITLTFDDLPSGTDVASHYAGIGVTASGATALVATSTPWPANSGLNIAYAPTGLMTFLLNSVITGNVETVSAYISDESSVGIYAYDAADVLLGQVVTLGADDNTFLSFTSAGNPIARIAIHDSGSSFAVDTLTFVSAAAVPEPMSLALLGLGLGAMTLTRRCRHRGNA